MGLTQSERDRKYRWAFLSGCIEYKIERYGADERAGSKGRNEPNHPVGGTPLEGYPRPEDQGERRDRPDQARIHYD